LQLISIQGELCARGYWNIPEKVSKANLLDWFEGQIERIGLKNLKDTLYFPQSSGNDELIVKKINKVTEKYYLNFLLDLVLLDLLVK
jgi:hypothetical protein